MLYLAWISAHDVAFDPAVHSTEDEFCLSGFVDESRQGDVVVPFFHVTVENTGAGSFLSQPERYAILSEKRSTDPVAVELARGRVLGLPADMGGATVELEFECTPPDADEVLKAAADAIRVGEVDYDPDAPAAEREDAECYDPLFYSPESSDDPAGVLAARPEVWKWNRTTLALERVHLSGGAVTHDIGGDGFEGSLRVSTLDPPRAVTKLRLVAAWTQEAKGEQDQVVGAGPQSVDTYSFDDFVSAFPQPGTPVGVDTGWHLAEARIESVTPRTIFEAFDVSPADYANGDASVTACQLLLGYATVAYHLRLGYDYQQQREEIADLSLPAATQPVLGDDRKETVEVIQLGSLNLDLVTPDWTYEDPDTLERMHYMPGDVVQANSKVWECVLEHDATTSFRAVTYTGATATVLWDRIPKRSAMPDPRAPSFLTTNRGKRAIRHGLRRLARLVLQRAHCLQIDFECEWLTARDMRVGHMARVENRRLPGGEATGWVSSVRLLADGAARKAAVTILVPVGDGSTAPVPEPGQEQTADIVYSVSATSAKTPVNAYTLQSRAPRVYEVVNDAVAQRTAALFGDPVDVIQGMPTHIRLAVDPLREEDLLRRRISVVCEPLTIPQGVVLTQP